MKHRRRLPTVLFLSALFLAPALAALGLAPRLAAGGREFFKPLRTDSPPVIDGRLDDEVWRRAPSVSGFKSFIPDFGRDPSEETAAYMAYDAENLYFAFKCFDKEPDKIKAAMAARDTIRADDFICINLDTFNDRQSLYALYVNPLGIQTDSRYAGGKEDFSVELGAYHVSTGFQTDVGYLTRQGVTGLFGSLTPKFYPKSRFVGGVTYKPSERFDLTGSLTFSDFFRESTKEKEFYLWRL